MRTFASIVLLGACLYAGSAHAQAGMKTEGIVVSVPASASVSHINEIADLEFEAKAKGKDKQEVLSRMSQTMAEGLARIRASDASAKLQTGSFQNVPRYKPAKRLGREEVTYTDEVIGWEISQTVTVTTSRLAELPKLAAAAQEKLTLSEVRFRLTPETTAKLREQRVAATYASLNETVAAIAKAMGKTAGDATLESISLEDAKHRGDFEGYAPAAMMVEYKAEKPKSEPVFEPGETTLHMSLVGKVKFK